jgi:hypothetical protein
VGFFCLVFFLGGDAARLVLWATEPYPSFLVLLARSSLPLLSLPSPSLPPFLFYALSLLLPSHPYPFSPFQKRNNAHYRSHTQVRDVSRVCNAVATSDLTQKITVPVQGDLMVQLKKVRSRLLLCFFFFFGFSFLFVSIPFFSEERRGLHFPSVTWNACVERRIYFGSAARERRVFPFFPSFLPSWGRRGTRRGCADLGARIFLACACWCWLPSLNSHMFLWRDSPKCRSATIINSSGEGWNIWGG